MRAHTGANPEPSKCMEPLIRTKELAATVNVSVACLERWRQQGKGPRWIRLAGRTIVYPVSEVQAWLSAQRAETDGGIGGRIAQADRAGIRPSGR